MSNNDCNCGDSDQAHDCCGCGEHGAQKITIETDGEQIECSIFGVFESHDREYVALLPEDSEDILIFRYSENNGEIEITDMESDEEYENVAETFYEVFSDDLENLDDFDDFDEEDDYEDEDEKDA